MALNRSSHLPAFDPRQGNKPRFSNEWKEFTQAGVSEARE